MSAGDYAVYEVGAGRERVRYYYDASCGETAALTPLEREVDRVIYDGFDEPGHFDTTGMRDPYKEAEYILAEHFGFARMVEANYEFVPGVRY